MHIETKVKNYLKATEPEHDMRRSEGIYIGMIIASVMWLVIILLLVEAIAN